MGVPQVSCKCLKTCRELINEVDFAKEDFFRSNTGIIQINDEPKNQNPSQLVSVNTFAGKTEITSNIKSEDINNNYDIQMKGNFRNQILEEPEENKNNFIISNNSNENKLKSCYSIRFLNDEDRNYFLTENIQRAEKNFKSPLNYQKDWAKYCNDNDNEDMLILINSINNNKGIHHTKKGGEVIEHDGKKFFYNGELDKNQRPIGFGILYSEGEKFEGNFIKGKLIGLGRYINKEGTCFEGIFENGNIISKAKIIKFNENNKKTIYFGDVKDFKKNGNGEEICENYKYRGEFLNDLRHGEGRLEFGKDGDIYEGEFEKGNINGKGLYIWSNKEQYKGDFVNGVKHGKGIYIWPEGNVYEGDYNNGIREGRGIYKWNDGRIFEGMFKNGKPEGKGKLTFNKKTIICEYKNGKPITNIKKAFQQLS